MPKMPALNPYLAPNIICPLCGTVLVAETVAMGKGRVSEVKYVCINPEKDCGWVLTVSLQHILGEVTNLKPEELDKRRAEAKAAAEFSATRENALRELIAMLPTLKTIAGMLKEDPPQLQAATAGLEIAKEADAGADPAKVATAEGSQAPAGQLGPQQPVGA